MLTPVLRRMVDHPCIKHRSLDMTMPYARMAYRTVADEYFAVSEKVEALYGSTPALPCNPAKCGSYVILTTTAAST